MSAPRMIEADGITQPLETYLDARGFVRIEPQGSAPRPDSSLRFEVVTLAGELRPLEYGSGIDWPNVAAYLLLDAPGHQPCWFCNTSPDESVICDDCEDAAEYY